MAPKPKSWGVKPTLYKTVFANPESRKAYQTLGEGSNKLIFMPGRAHPDYRYMDTAFACVAGSLRPDYDQPFAKFGIQWEGGRPKLTSTLYDGYANQVQEIYDAVQKYGYKRGMEHVATAAIVNTSTISATKALNILDRVLGLQTREYLLEMAVTKVPAPQLVFTVDEYTEGSVQGKVPELDTPDLISHSETRTTKILYKNVGHLAESEEAALMASHNTMALRQDKTMRDMVRLLNSQLGTELEAASDVAGGDWGVLDPTYFISNRNPSADIQPVITTIQGNGFNVDFMAGHDRPAMDLLNNDHVKGRGATGPTLPGQTSVAWNSRLAMVPGMPPVIIDQALTNTLMTVGSKDAVWLGEGPTVVANYQNDLAGYRGWLIKQWRFPYLANAGAIRNLTGVSA